MKEITRSMIKLYNLDAINCDFLGYERIKLNGEPTFHHLIIPKKDGGPEEIENGAVILRKPHIYLHMVQEFDEDIFKKITDEMIVINKNLKIDLENLRKIDDLLKSFEREYTGKYTFGKPIVTEERTIRLIQKLK